MKSFTRELGGKKAKANGASWERVFAQTCTMYGVDCYKLPEGARRVGLNRLIPVPVAFDFILGFEDRAVFVDTKTIDKGNFSYSLIKPHQLEGMSSLLKAGNSGYVIRSPKGVHFAPLGLLRSVREKGSVNLEECVRLGDELLFDPRLIFKTV